MKDKHRVLLTGLVVVAVVGWLWAASAFWQYRNLRAQIHSLRTQTAETAKLIERAKEQRERYEQLVRELGKPLTNFDPGRLTAKFMEQIEGALTQSKIKAETIQPLPWQINSEMRAVRISVQVTATTTQPTISEGLQSLTELLMRLRSVRPPVFVERLNVQATSQPREGLRIQAQLVWLVPVEESVLRKWVPQTRRPIRR